MEKNTTKWIIREQQSDSAKYNAGSKARNDVDEILVKEGYKPLVIDTPIYITKGIIHKIIRHFEKYHLWKSCLNDLCAGDIVVIQLPIRNHTVLFSRVLSNLKKKGVIVIGIIHDLESLRFALAEDTFALSKMALKHEDRSMLDKFSHLIVHNEYMKEAIHSSLHIPKSLMTSLDIFDYLSTCRSPEIHSLKDPIVIAGNLSAKKSGYVYHLPADERFELFGANLDTSVKLNQNITYKGVFAPEDLPAVLNGSFGLVWDGPSTETCEGVFGNYLRINNPHKASLYLVSGLPLIVWSKSAMADFVIKNNCGFCVETCNDISSVINEMSDAAYTDMLDSVGKIRKKLLDGEYTRQTLKNAEQIIQEECKQS